MPNGHETREKIVRIKTLEHRSGGLFMAVSDDLPGLSIAGLSTEEIEEKLPEAVREYLELSGFKVISIDISRDARVSRAQFGLPSFIAHASLMVNQAA